MTAVPPYVFSVDLEDVRSQVVGADRYAARVVAMTGRYLAFLSRYKAKGTFFVVGEVARAHPELIRRIVADGHEIGCHSDRHIPLERHDAASFRADLTRNLDALRAAGADDIRGFRAPCFSLVEKTRWAYPILAELGFDYSSSVLPARNPLYGWPEFGPAPRLVDNVLELPMTMLPYRLLSVPMAGGVYFRVLPRALLRRALRKRHSRNEPVLGYLHPYDIDAEQERFAHPGFARWSPYNWLIYANRNAVFDRLELVAGCGFQIISYRAHVDAVRPKLPRG
jgi:polysaccharide deacetylase family protein (PEP-CTERM system associated)